MTPEHLPTEQYEAQLAEKVSKTIPDNRHDVSIRFMDFVRDNPREQVFEDDMFTIRYF